VSDPVSRHLQQSSSIVAAGWVENPLAAQLRLACCSIAQIRKRFWISTWLRRAFGFKLDLSGLSEGLGDRLLDCANPSRFKVQGSRFKVRMTSAGSKVQGSRTENPQTVGSRNFHDQPL